MIPSSSTPTPQMDGETAPAPGVRLVLKRQKRAGKAGHTEPDGVTRLSR